MKILLTVVSCFFLLVGCSGNTTELYVFGPGKSCYQGKGTEGLKNCKTYSAYDKLTLSTNLDKQEVTYQLAAARLDSSNVVFKTLTNCKIIDSKNFSCDGFSISEGKPIDTKIFGKKIISNVGWLFSVSTFFENEIKIDHINFVTKNNYWVAPLAIFMVVVGFFAIAN